MAVATGCAEQQAPSSHNCLP